MNPPLILLLALVGWLMPLTAFSSSAPRPNIVLVVMDNFGWGEPGFNGGGIIRGAATPQLDTLAAEGHEVDIALVLGDMKAGVTGFLSEEEDLANTRLQFTANASESGQVFQALELPYPPDPTGKSSWPSSAACRCRIRSSSGPPGTACTTVTWTTTRKTRTRSDAASGLPISAGC